MAARHRNGGARTGGAAPGASSPGYRIGTVSSLTGLDSHTIRAWERRYRAVAPSRSEGGTRLYSDDDVMRLQLIKAAREYGDAVGSVARLSNAALRSRLAKLAGIPARPGSADAKRTDAATPLRVAVLGGLLVEQLRTGATPGLELVVAVSDRSALLEALRSAPVDVLVLAGDRLGQEPLATFEAARELGKARLVLVVYEFARRHLLDQLAAAGARLLRGPLTAEELRRALVDHLVLEEARRLRPSHESAARVDFALGEEIPARLFDDGQLARLAALRSSVECECPNHLSTLVSSLLAFERYSRECESRDLRDQALHARLARGTARARSLMEHLLTELCEYDGIRP